MFHRVVPRVDGGRRVRARSLASVLAVEVGLSRVLDMGVLLEGLAAAGISKGGGHVSKGLRDERRLS